MAQEWFASWFNSPYYHLLYNNRNEQEAEHFIQGLAHHLQLPVGARVLDLACGKGRHSITLNKLGFDTTGVDLSDESIKYATQFENEHLHFAVHDMRNVLAVNYFDVVCNLFTSFGYLKTERENLSVAKAMVAAAKPGALLVVDFFNAHKVRHAIKENNASKQVQRDDVVFDIQKRIEANVVFKKIIITDKKEHVATYEEQVQLIDLASFIKLFAGIAELKMHFGSYKLDAYDEVSSDRLIMVFNKI
jgi:SAM-dependent methyltransferase